MGQTLESGKKKMSENQNKKQTNICMQLSGESKDFTIAEDM